MFIKGNCDAGEIRNKPPKYVIHAEERANFGLRSEVFEFCHQVGCMLCESQAAWSDNMTHVVSIHSGELTFLCLECNSRFVEQPQYAPNLFVVARRRYQEYDNAI